MEWLYNIEALKLMDILIEKGIKVDLLLTDPPYDIPKINGGGSINTVKKLNSSLQDLTRSNLMFSYNIENFGEKLFALQKGNINAYFWCNKKQIPEYLKYYVGTKDCKFDIITWHKTNALPTYSNKYLSDTEYCLYFRKGKGHCFPANYEDAKTFMLSPLNQTDKKKWKHPTIKPLEYIEKMVRNSSKEGELVFDPFMGSGTTGVACKKLGRNFIGGDLDPEWVSVAKNRIATDLN